jgi:tRNA-splicing endonuclease subunit Sen34
MSPVEAKAASSPPSPWPVRISKIAGRFLVFDARAASLLRRHENTNGTLVGTLPQQPTQNIFLGLPIELRPEEVHALVAKDAAYVVDNVGAHQAALRHPDRAAYVESLRRKKQVAQRLASERNAQKAAEASKRHGRTAQAVPSQPRSQPKAEVPSQNAPDDDDALFQDRPQNPAAMPVASEAYSWAVTPTISGDLVPKEIDDEFVVDDVPEGPLARFLQSGGYYMTPGLRFGAQYSVYPGDPLRFHAHFMANQYDWDENIPILNLVEGGRLATAVKKAFVIGGQSPRSRSDSAVKTFSLEWAAM